VFRTHRSILHRLILFALSCAFLPPGALAQIDVPVTAAGPNQTLAANVTWTGSGLAAFGNNYLVTPVSPDVGLCVAVQNFDTAMHSFNIAAAISSNQQRIAYAGNAAAWQPIGGTIRGNVGAAGSTLATQTFFFRTVGATQVAIVTANVSPSTGTTSLYAVHTSQAGCATTAFPLQQTVSRFATTSYNQSTAYTATACVTNPGAAYPLLSLNGDPALVLAVPSTFALSRVTLSSTVAAQINVNQINNAGTGCTPVTPANVNRDGGATALGNAQTGAACSANPGLGPTVDQELLGASAPISLDLSGYWIPAQSGGGFEITNPASITGVVCVNLYWSEQ
jgi:hypothetical protein